MHDLMQLMKINPKCRLHHTLVMSVSLYVFYVMLGKTSHVGNLPSLFVSCRRHPYRAAMQEVYLFAS